MNSKCFFLIFVVFTLSLSVNAQVTIGSNKVPDTNALLDLKEDNGTTKGVLPPRVSLTSTGSISPLSNSVAEGMTVYNTATQNDVNPGYYYFYNGKWVRLESDPIKPKFFYMPSIMLPVDPGDPCSCYSNGIFTINLHTKYSEQFGTPKAKSQYASNSLPVYSATEVNYYITYYDTAVFSDVNVSATGVLTYKIVANPSISEKSFMNIVFEVR